MAAGIAKAGDRAWVVSADTYRTPQFDVAVFYGLEDRLRRALKEYPASGRHAVYVDLGYWGRIEGGKLAGYHKIVVDGRHPTAYFQRKRHDDARIAHFGLRIAPWRRPKPDSAPILLAGMGSKAAQAENMAPEAWERAAIERIRAVTARPILYRPKPSWKAARPIEGCDFSHRSVPIEMILGSCHAVVTHHSNVGVDAIVAGIPTFTEEGVARPLRAGELADIERPAFPEGREQWLSDISYCQWTVAEMAAGLPWQHLKAEGLLPR